MTSGTPLQVLFPAKRAGEVFLCLGKIKNFIVMEVQASNGC